MQVIFVILLHIDYTLSAKYEIFLKYLLFKRKIPYFYYKMPGDMPEPFQLPAVQADLYMDSGV